MKTFRIIELITLVVLIVNKAGVTGQLNRLTAARQYQTWLELKDNVATALEENEYSKLDIEELLRDLLSRLFSTSFPTAVATGIDPKCQNDSILYTENLFQLNGSWARQMQESSGKVPLGLYGAGNFHADGLFDECLAVRAPGFTGQYCTTFFKVALVNQSEVLPTVNRETRRNLVTIFKLLGILISSDGRVEPKTAEADVITYAFPSISFCLPSSCSAQDLGQSVAHLIGGYIFGNYSIVTVADEQYCFKGTDSPKDFDGAEITVIVVLSFLGLVVVMATAHDALQMYREISFDPKRESKWVSGLHCFSILTNGRKILSMKVSKNSTTNLSCVHGIRFLSTCWVVIGHTWIIGAASNAVNPNKVRQDAMFWWFQGIANATLSVDTFLMMSGLLVAYLLLAELEKNKGKFNFGYLYLHRYLRLTIVYAIILGFLATLAVHIGTGPNWYNVETSAYGCRINWWWHFLYINNLFPTDINVQCMEQTWYLALDMQLFIMAPLVIYLLWRKANFGLAVLFFFFIGTIAANFTIFAVFDLMPTVMPTRTFDTLDMGLDADYYYTKPWTRAPPYIVGVWLGWFLHTTKQSQKRTSKIILVSFWTTSLVIMGLVIYGLIPYLDENEVPTIDPTLSVFYGSLHRTAWAMSVAWIVFACTRGYGGFVNRLLSWKGFMPLSRLSYCVYLIHYDYLNIFYAANRKLVYYTFFTQLTSYFGIVLTVFGLAFLVCITVESSFLNLEKLIVASLTKSDRKNSVETPPRGSSSTRRINWKTKSFDKY